MRTQLVYFALFAGLAGAAGLESKSIYAVEAIKSIMSGALTDCSQFEFSKECRTPEEAAPHLINSLKGRTTGEIAMILSLIGVESGDLKFRINHFPSPGHPDQGTANMMSPMYVSEYAKDLNLPIDGKSGPEILQLVIADDFRNFDSARWFVDKHCSDEVKAKMRMGTDEGYSDYITKCVGTTMADDRQQYWDRAKKAFDLSG
ncbi:hypothetical protein QR685DRAFT_509066 [Neurospora intermedia]|uniref:Uncharacterized protein n=1 Tax=Neurospora intermedia TaxID=5142 RepID=A0ABR3DPA5_NEUIN